MRCSMYPAVMAISLSVVIPCAAADVSSVLDQARSLLARHDARSAVDLLEDAVADAGANRAAVLDLLRRAYESAAREAEAAGKPAIAERHRDNLEILNRKSAPRPATPASTAVNAPIDAPVARASTAEVKPVPLSPAASEPQPSPATSTAPADISVASADAAFVARRYDDAGRIYAALDRDQKMPASRKDHWAYCRWVEVVRRINARPATPDEWASIDAEILKIRELSPKNWFGEYLRNRAADRPKGAGNKQSSLDKTSANKLVVRASSPDEEGPSAPPASAAPASEPTAPQARPEPTRPNAPTGSWQVRETASFRIMHDDPELAEKVAQLAESGREQQIRRWAGSSPRGPWSPRCDIYIYPTAAVFSQMTNQPEESPGFSTMGMNAGKIIARRVNLRADHPNLLHAILPHEITHVVLADLFPHQQIPRWADEGMAVLSEPRSEQGLRAADLDAPLAAGRLFHVEDLMVMDYPDGKFWGLYYAQSVSLTRFLVEQSSPARFIEYVQSAQRNGHEAELRRIYKIDGFADLQKRWLAYARNQTSAVTASSDKKTDATTGTRSR
jgi:hypothetical protein